MTQHAASDDTDDDQFPLEALVSLPEFYHPFASPDGEHVGLYWDESGRNELYLLDPDTGDRTQVSDENVPRNAYWPYLWHPDGDRLYFHQDDGGDEQHDVHAIDLDGDTEQVVDVQGQCFLLDVAPDGDALFYRSDRREQMSCYRHDLASGESTQLTAYERPTEDASVSPDGDRLAYVTNESADMENRDVYVAAIDDLRDAPAPREDGDQATRRLDVGIDGSQTMVEAWGPDGDRLLLSDDAEDTKRAGVYDLEGAPRASESRPGSDAPREEADAVTWLGDGSHEETGQTFTPDGERVLATRERRAGTELVVYDLADGTGRVLDLPDGVVSVPTYGPDSTFLDDTSFLVTHEGTASRKRLLVYDLATDESRVLKDADYGEFDPDDFVEAEYVTYESSGGDTEHAWPSEGDHETYEIGALLYDSGERPSPGVVKVHGGPHGQSKRSFGVYTQFLVDRGYTVLCPNYRGSTGRGREFRTAIQGDWGGAEQGDIAEGGRWLMDRDWVDEDRVAVYGGSYGGYSAYMQLVKYPELWATGIASVGMTDLQSLYEESMPHFQTGLEQMVGDPDEHPERYRERSAITHVDRIERPLLMVHGVNDPRCPISQARDFRDALEDRGLTAGEDGDFEYTELGEEGHASSDIEQKIRTTRILSDYLARRL
jgi:dipeptidyl aminopeptidase/acylaminoacyl peptidase